MTTNNESPIAFRRINSLQLGMIPLHLYLLEYIYKHPINLVKVNIPLEAVRTSLSDTFSIQLVVADSFRDSAYLLLFFFTACFVLAYMDYIELCLRVKRYGEGAPKAIGFFVAVIAGFFLMYLYFSDTLSTTISLKDIPDMGVGFNSIRTLIYDDWGVILLSLIPVILIAFSPVKISDLLQLIIAATIYKDRDKEDTAAQKQNDFFNWLFVLIIRLAYLLILTDCSIFKIISWRWKILIALLFSTILFIFWLLFYMKLKQLQVDQFCQNVRMEWGERDSWAEEFHRKMNTLQENKNELSDLKNNSNNRRHYDSDLILLLKIGMDIQKSSALADDIKTPLLKKELRLPEELSQICESENKKVIFNDKASDLLIKADERIFGSMIEYLMAFLKEIEASDSPMVINAPDDEAQECLFSIQLAVKSSAVDVLSRTLDFIQFSETVTPEEICRNADALILSEIYAELNELSMQYAFVDGQIFCLTFTIYTPSIG